MQAKLNATTIKTLQPAAKPYEVVDTEIKGFLLRVQPTGRKTYYFAYRSPSGAKKRIKLGVVGQVTPAQARDEALVQAGEVAKGIDVQGTKVAAREEAKDARQRTLRAFVDSHYRKWAEANLKTAKATLDRLEDQFKEFMPLALEDVTVRRVEQWRTQAAAKGLAPSTINRAVTCLRGVLTKALEWDFLATHPLERLKPLKTDKTPNVRFLSADESERLQAALDKRDQGIKDARASGNRHREERGYPLLPDLSRREYPERLTPMVLLSLKTGLRRGELFDLRVEDFDRKAKLVTVRGEGAKSGQTRHIPLSPKAFEILTTWIGEEEVLTGRIFPAENGGRLDNVNNSWRKLLRDAKIAGFRWHDMRHDFASKLVMRGVPLNTVRELCGHSDLNTTLRYAHLAPDHKSEAIALID